MGGVMKGGYAHMHPAYNSSSNSSRRRCHVYVLMGIIVFVFGCGILAVMGIQRLKDRRVLDLLIKEKDDRILFLHLLLKKERNHMKEVQSKAEEIKMTIYNLRTEKAQLNNRLLEMQSTISSLKEEQRTIELAFQEKQNEAKLLRERYAELQDQNPQVKALTEILKQKEAEIEDLKHHLQLPVSTDEASVIPSNVTAKANVSGIETVISMHESSMQSEEQRENGTLVEGRGEMTMSEKFDRLENSQEESVENVITDVAQNGRKTEMGREKKERVTEMNENLGKEERNPRAKDSEELATLRDAHSRKTSKDRDSDNQELGLHKVRYRGKYYLRRTKGKRWRPIANGQRLGEGAAEIGDNLEEGMPRNQEIQDSVMGLGMQKESALKNQQFRTGGKLPDAGQDNVKANVRGYDEENNGENSEDSPPGIMLRNRIEPVDNDEMNYTDSSSVKSHTLSSKATVQHAEEDGQSKEQGIITEHTENKNEGKHNNNSGQTEDAETNENSDNTQTQNLGGTKLGTITSTGSARDSEEEEQTDETEF